MFAGLRRDLELLAVGEIHDGCGSAVGAAGGIKFIKRSQEGAPD